ncbi:uncharacterized protein LOC142550716 [Primulina tabacum]|uniref:uncharacterized protein LOC142550716 n=1 Tax=Primulina tabacum TaxID=48773 RepID=UPI003F5A3721
MDEQERKEYFSLPPDYVTICILRERWLQKQEEEKLKEKQEQQVLQETQNFEKDCKNQPHGEREVCHRSENHGPREGVGKVGGEMDFMDEREKGKEKMGWSGDGRIMNKRHYRVNYLFLKTKNESAREWLDLVEKKNGSKGVEIILKNKEKVGIAGFPCGESSGTQGIGKRVNVGMIEVLPKNCARGGSSQISTALDVRRDGFSGGFRSEENDHWDEGFCGKERGVKLKELKDNNSLGKKMEAEVLQIDGKGNGRKRGQRRHQDTLVMENRVEDTVLAEKDRNDGFRGYGDRRGNLREKLENLTIDDRKGPYMGSKVERNFGCNSRHVKSGRLKVDWKMKQSNYSMVWVKKEQSGAVGGEASSMGASPDK